MIKNTIGIVILLFSTMSFLNAQDAINFEHFKQIKPRNIGPAGMSGRVTAIDVDLSNDDRIFVGTASGGLWFSPNGGVSWEPVFDKVTPMSIGAVKINQSNPSEIWVGTGEGNPRNSQNSGAGVYRSIDGGKTWEYKGLKDTKVIHRIAIDESRPGVVYIGAQGSAWGASADRGVYKTIDGGDTWQKVLYVNDQTGIADMVMDPHNPNKIIAAMWEFGRTPAFFNSGGKGSGLHITHDGGKSWKRITDEDGFPKGNLGRIGVAISRSNSEVVYALVEAKENAMYKSFDGGAKWTKISTDENMGNRPFYYSEIYVDPQNENRLYSLYTYVSMSEDGGKTYKVIADYGNNVHPDHHAFWIHPEDPSYLIDGNDGGMAISHDMGRNWRFVNNLPVGQFYHINVDNEFPYNVYGGMQDNGSWVGPGFTLKSGGITNHDWQEVYFGDGFDVAPKPGNARYVYAMSQGGNIGLVDRETGLGKFIRPNHPDTVELRFNWNAPMALQPESECGLYFGSQFVHFSEDCGQSWKIISPDLTTNDTSKQHQDISGGLTYDATNAENNTTLIAIAPSSLDKNVIWVGSDDGRLHLSQDHGTTWTDLYGRLPGAPVAGWIPQVKASDYSPAEAWVVVNNYRQNDWRAFLYHTEDYGKTWKNLVDDKRVEGFVTSVLQDKQEPNLIFLGTDIGLYISFDKGKKWNKMNEGFPSVQVSDMTVQETFDDLAIGTFGRAFWIIDDIGTYRALAEKDYTTSEFELVSASPAYLSESRSYQGIRFYAQGEFVGDNKGTDPIFSIWVKPSKADDKEAEDTEKKEKKKMDKIAFAVVDAAGDTIRHFSREVSKEKGLQRISWNLRRDGVEYPSRRERKEDADPPAGAEVLPGKYTVIASYGEHKDMIEVNVKMDPRVEITATDVASLKSSLDEMDQWVERATAQFNKIKEAKKSLALIEKLTETIQDTTKEDLVKMNKKIGKKLTELEELFVEKEDQKGIQRNPETVSAYLGGARRYIGSSYGQPNENAMLAFEKAKSKVSKVEEEISKFFDEDWTEYRSKIEAMNFSLFKD